MSYRTYRTTTFHTVDNTNSLGGISYDNPTLAYNSTIPVRVTDRDVRLYGAYGTSRINTDFTPSRFSDLPGGYKTGVVGSTVRPPADSLTALSTRTAVDITPAAVIDQQHKANDNIDLLKIKMEGVQKQFCRFDAMESEIASVRTSQMDRFRSIDADLSSVKLRLKRFDEEMVENHNKYQEAQRKFHTKSARLGDLERELMGLQRRLDRFNSDSLEALKMADLGEPQFVNDFTSGYIANKPGAENYRHMMTRLQSQLNEKVIIIDTLKEDLHEKEAELRKIQINNEIENITNPPSKKEVSLQRQEKSSDNDLLVRVKENNSRSSSVDRNESIINKELAKKIEALENQFLAKAETSFNNVNTTPQKQSCEKNETAFSGEAANKELAKKIEALEKQFLAKAESSFNNVNTTPQKEETTPSGEATSEVRKMEEALAEKTKEIEQLKHENKTLTNDCDVFYEKMIHKYGTMQDDYKTLKEQHACAAEKQADSEAIINELKLSLTQELEQSKIIQEKQIASCEELEKMQSVLFEKENELKRLKQICEIKDRDISELKKLQVDNNVETELRDARAALKEKTNELVVFQQRYDSLNSEFNSLQKENELNCDKIEQLKQEILSKSEEIDDLRLECKKKEFEIVSLRSDQNNTYSEALSVKQKEIDQRTKEKVELESKLHELSATQNTKESELQGLQQRHDNLQNELTKFKSGPNVDDLLAQIESLQNLLQEKDTLLAEKERECKGFESLKDEFRAKQDKMSNMAKELVSAHRRLSLQPDQLIQQESIVRSNEKNLPEEREISNVDISMYEIKEEGKSDTDSKDCEKKSEYDDKSEISEIHDATEKSEYSSDSSVTILSETDSESSTSSKSNVADDGSDTDSKKSIIKSVVEDFDDFFGIAKSNSSIDLNSKSVKEALKVSVTQSVDSDNFSTPRESFINEANTQPHGDFSPDQTNKSPSTGCLGDLPPLLPKTSFSENNKNILTDLPPLTPNKTLVEERDCGFKFGADNKSISDGECVEESVADDISDFQDGENDIANILDNL